MPRRPAAFPRPRRPRPAPPPPVSLLLLSPVLLPGPFPDRNPNRRHGTTTAAAQPSRARSGRRPAASLSHHADPTREVVNRERWRWIGVGLLYPFSLLGFVQRRRRRLATGAPTSASIEISTAPPEDEAHKAELALQRLVEKKSNEIITKLQLVMKSDACLSCSSMAPPLRTGEGAGGELGQGSKIVAIRDSLEDPDQPEDKLVSLLQNLEDGRHVQGDAGLFLLVIWRWGHVQMQR